MSLNFEIVHRRSGTKAQPVTARAFEFLLQMLAKMAVAVQARQAVGYRQTLQALVRNLNKANSCVSSAFDAASAMISKADPRGVKLPRCARPATYEPTCWSNSTME